MNYTGDYNKDCVNTGNMMYNTINLPLIALETKRDIEKFFTKLDEVCEICYESLLHRRNVIIDAVYNKHLCDFLIQKDKETGEPLWDIDRTTITLGYCGLNECLEVLTGRILQVRKLKTWVRLLSNSSIRRSRNFMIVMDFVGQ